MSIAIAEERAQGVVLAGPRLRSVLALTRVEARRLITHPAILAPPALIVLRSVREPGALRFLLQGDFLLGIGYFALGIGTFLAANLQILAASS